MSVSAKQAAAYRARVARMGAEWMAANPDGQLRRAVAGILWWDHPHAFARQPESMLVDCNAVDASHLRAALVACGYTERDAARRSHRPKCRDGYGDSLKFGGNHVHMVGGGAPKTNYGIWAEPWTDGNSRTPIHRGAFA